MRTIVSIQFHAYDIADVHIYWLQYDIDEYIHAL